MDGKSLVLPTLNIDKVSEHARFLILSLPNNEMLQKSPFAIHKAIQGISGEPKSVKKLRSGDLLIETSSALQTKSLFHKLPSNIKAGYLNCKLRPYISNPLRCFKCQRLSATEYTTDDEDMLMHDVEEELESGPTDKFVFKESPSNFPRGYIRYLTPTRFRKRHSSTDCTLEPKCINCSQLHTTDSKLCPKWKTKKQIQEIKINKNISYFEASKLIVPQLTQTYAQSTKPSSISTTTQTDSNITNIICPPLQCLRPASSNPMPSTSSSMSTVSTSSSSSQAHLLSSSSATMPTVREVESSVSLSESAAPASNDEHFNASHIPKQLKQNSKNRRKRTKAQKAEIEIKMAKHKPRKSAPTEYTTDDEDMLMHDVEEELESGPTDKFVFKESPSNFPRGYIRYLTPTRFRKSRK
ncbi:RNA-directed DNA polymerase from mobile element jockey [Trichonephila clavipes]|nr:RNA-directed DNA polymerase from mobile element jockey [Trichonephila clavipes]